MTQFAEEQVEAIERREGSLLLAANAGSGKTAVLTERLVRSMTDDEIGPAALLAITFTDRAASELRRRVRERFIELGDPAGARAAEGAWISTIHGFCARVLRAHAVVAGLDPAFSVLDEPAARALRARAFDRALSEFLDDVDGAPRADALELAATWTPDRLCREVLALHDLLRSRGMTAPALPTAPPPADVGALYGELAAAALRMQAELALAAPNRSVEAARQAVERLASFTCGNAKALDTEACAAYLAAHERHTRALRDHAAVPLLALFDELLQRFGDCYEQAKAAASAIDYDDLELRVRDLFAAEPAIAAAYAERFTRVMVDEFQDTNPLQVEILGFIERDNAFYVGDELQSIYGFRNADVRGFRSKREQLDVGVLATNWRSRPEILETLNAAFGGLHENYTPLLAGRADERGATPAVELLITDSGEWDAVEQGSDIELRRRVGAGLPDAKAFRHAEARAVARRVRRLVDEGEAAPEDVVILTRTATDQHLYERALELEGLATLASGGRGFWARQQVQDLLGYLGALANPRDEISLWALLASPLVGLSADAMALLALEGRERGRPVGDVIAAETLPADLAADDSGRLAAFRDWFEGERALAPRLALDVLLTRAIARAGYDMHVLGLPDGRRRLANVSKLVRLAAAFETSHGRDIRAFMDHATAEIEAGAREPDAPVELGGLKAVRLMTIHAAKGLEFPVVVVADLGRKLDASVPDVLVDGERVGIRIVTLDDEQSLGALAHDELKEEARLAARAEERRVLHVALTRACEKLILSGSQCLTKPWPKDGAGAAPFAWLGPALAADPAELVESGAGVRLLVVRNAPDTADAVLGESPPKAVPSAGQAPDGAVAPAGSAEGAAADVAAPLVTTLSYSALAAYGRCGYRFYLERVLRLAPRDEDAWPARGEGGGLDLRMRGTLVHELLEQLDFAAPPAIAPAAVRAVAAAHGLELSDAEVADLQALIAGFAGSALYTRLAAAADIHREHGFAFVLGDPGDRHAALVTGFVDVRARDARGALVVDYKSDRVSSDQDLEALVERDYGAQRRIYALAELRAGAAAVEVAYVFLELPGAVVSSTYVAADAATLEAELRGLAAGIGARRFEVAPEPNRRLCSGCPGRGSLCSYDRELTEREPATLIAPDAAVASSRGPASG